MFLLLANNLNQMYCKSISGFVVTFISDIFRDICRSLCSGYSVELASKTLLSNYSMLIEQRRQFLPGLPNPFGSGKGKKLVYAEEVVLGWVIELNKFNNLLCVGQICLHWAVICLILSSLRYRMYTLWVTLNALYVHPVSETSCTMSYLQI